MSWRAVNVAICHCCARDVAGPLQYGANTWAVVCHFNSGGCRAHSAFGETEIEAITIWNAGLVCCQRDVPALGVAL